MIDIVTETTAASALSPKLGRKDQRQAFVLALSDALRPIADPRVVADTACHLLVEHLGADRALYTEAEGTLVLPAPAKQSVELDDVQHGRRSFLGSKRNI